MADHGRHKGFPIQDTFDEAPLDLGNPDVPEPEKKPFIGSAGFFSRLVELESGGNPNAVNETTGALGLHQFLPRIAEAYDLSDPTNPEESNRAATQLTAENAKYFTNKKGRDPADWELYLLWQQGATGGTAILNGGNENIVDVLEKVSPTREHAEQAVTANGGTVDMTAEQFAELWQTKFIDGPEITQPPSIIPVTREEL